MTEQNDLDAARALAQAFFDAMLDWERFSAQVSDEDADGDQRRAKLTEIFETYLSAKALQRDQSRYEFLDYGEPPEFAEKILETESAGKDKVWVYVPEGVIGGRARYLLKKEGGAWKVDTKESDVANKGQWKKNPDL